MNFEIPTSPLNKKAKNNNKNQTNKKTTNKKPHKTPPPKTKKTPQQQKKKKRKLKKNITFVKLAEQNKELYSTILKPCYFQICYTDNYGQVLQISRQMCYLE